MSFSNRHKGSSLQRATSLGLAAAQLPVARHLRMHAHPILTVNHVIQLLQLISANQTWPEALSVVVPPRKQAASLAAPATPPADATLIAGGDSSGAFHVAHGGAAASAAAADGGIEDQSGNGFAFPVDDKDHSETPLQVYPCT